METIPAAREPVHAKGLADQGAWAVRALILLWVQLHPLDLVSDQQTLAKGARLPPGDRLRVFPSTQQSSSLIVNSHGVSLTKGHSHPRERPFVRFPNQRAQTRPSIQGGIEMLTQVQIQALKAPFPPEALTSIKAAQAPAVIGRLNEVLGPCGVGWRHAHSPFEELHTNSGRAEIVTEVAPQYCAGCDQVVWDAQANDWAFRR